MDFEWDPDKAAYNLKLHGISFAMAVGAFADGLALERLDDREEYGEDRIVLVGQAQGTLLTVVYTERGQAIRIISARRATRNEQNEYYRENSL
jgi:uncharacterized DUF497 family protein